jgi:hypothetical protein
MEEGTRGDTDGSRDAARETGGGCRVDVGDEVRELDLRTPKASFGAETEFGLDIAAGAVGGDKSDILGDGLGARAGPPCGFAGSNGISGRLRGSERVEVSPLSALGPVGG